MCKALINIIIPVYNAEKTLERCLESVMSQTYQGPWRAILIDDASGDGSREMMRRAAQQDSRFVCVYNQNNLGASATRNVGLELVKEGYAAFLDSDDWWEPEMLECLYDLAVKNDADIAQCGFFYNYPGGKQYTPPPAFDSGQVLDRSRFDKVYYRMATGINMNHVCMKLIRAEVIEGVQFLTTLKTAEDLAFCVELFKRAKRYAYVPKPLYHYYRDGSGLTGSRLSGAEKWKANRAVSGVIQKNLKELGADGVFLRILVALRPFTITVSKIYRMLLERRSLKSNGEQ